ncbi:MAG: oligosaccharide flippase family protein [Nitrospiraceae bacterium]|nr:oligosaccharide flippase family protein [Nitrospiraceae bacterium]
MSVRRTLARNTAFNAAGRLWEALANLVLAAYIVSQLGLPVYGLWSLVSVFTGYVALLDFGVGSGYAKYIAEHAARGERDRLSHVVSTGLLFYLLLGVVLVVTGWACVDGLIALAARLSPERMAAFAEEGLVDDVRFLLRGALLLFSVSNCIAAFSALQTGLQRMGITNVISFVASILKVAATILFLELGHGVRGLLYANGAVLLFFGTASVLVAFHLAPGLRISVSCVRRETMGRLFSYGWRTQVSKLSNLITFQTDKLIILVASRWLGLSGVYVVLDRIGAYRLGEELASKMRQAPALLLSAVIPAASDLDARGDEERLRRLYLLSSKYVAAVTVPLVAIFAGCAGMLIRTWMGEEPGLDVAAWTLRILVVGYLANIIPGAGVSVALGKGRPDVQMKAGIIAMVSNLTLTVVLMLTLGFYGVPLATAASMFLSCAWFIRAMRAVSGVGPGELVRVSLVWPIVAALPGLVVCIAGDWLSAGFVGRGPNAIMAMVCGGAFSISYLVLIRFTPFLDAFDVDFLANVLHLRRVPGFGLWSRRAARD